MSAIQGIHKWQCNYIMVHCCSITNLIMLHYTMYIHEYVFVCIDIYVCKHSLVCIYLYMYL